MRFFVGVVFVASLSVVHSSSFAAPTPPQEECLKNCGCGWVYNIGHRSCSAGEYGCHVTQCSYHKYPNCFFEEWDNYFDLCSVNADGGWQCNNYSDHFCVPDCDGY